jgi:ribonuclease HI
MTCSRIAELQRYSPELANGQEAYPSRQYQRLLHSPQLELFTLKWNEDSNLGLTCDVTNTSLRDLPEKVMRYRNKSIWYTDRGGVYKQQAPQDVRLKVNPCGRGSTNTITRAELTAILVALQQREFYFSDESIATDSQASLYMIDKQLHEPQKHEECKHWKLLAAIVDLLLVRAKKGCHTTFAKVKSHIGIRGNEIADQLAGEATDSSCCDLEQPLGNTGLTGMM